MRSIHSKFEDMEADDLVMFGYFVTGYDPVSEKLDGEAAIMSKRVLDRLVADESAWGAFILEVMLYFLSTGKPLPPAIWFDEPVPVDKENHQAQIDEALERPSVEEMLVSACQAILLREQEEQDS